MLKRIYWDINEVKSYLIVSLIFAFILTFNDWGTTAFDAAVGAVNLTLGFFLVLFSLIVHDIGHRLYAIRHGYKVKFRILWFGLLSSLLVCIVTGSINPNTYWMLFLGGAVTLNIHRHHRLGKFSYRPTMRHEAWIALAGPLASLALAALVKGIGTLLGVNGFLIQKLVWFNVLYAVYTMLPIPPLDGFKLAFWSRLWWAFWFGAVFGFMVLALFGIISFIFPLLIGAATFLLFYYQVET